MTIGIADVLTLLLLLLPTVYLEICDMSPFVRPIDLSDPSIRYPQVQEYISSKALLVFCILFPLFILVLTQRSKLRYNYPLITVFLFSILETLIITMLVTNIFKFIIGRPRPFFATVCESYTSTDSYQCTGDSSAVREARKSFPSGHSSSSFSICVFVTLYLYNELFTQKTFLHNSPKTIGILILICPCLISALVASSRIVDFHHHYADVIAGSILGSALGVAVYSVRKVQLTTLSKKNENESLLPTFREFVPTSNVEQQVPQM